MNPRIFGRRMRRSGSGFLLEDRKLGVHISMLELPGVPPLKWRFSVSFQGASVYSPSFYQDARDAARAVEELVRDMRRRLSTFIRRKHGQPKRPSARSKVRR